MRYVNTLFGRQAVTFDANYMAGSALFSHINLFNPLNLKCGCILQVSPERLFNPASLSAKGVS